MKKTANALVFAGAALLTGCFSMDIAKTDSLRESALSSDDGKPMEHVVVSNYGWYLFNCIPLACGNASPDAFFPWKLFSNQVTSNILHDRMLAHAASINADVRDLTFFRDEKVIFDLPGTDFPIPIPYVLCFREIQFSGTLTQRQDKQPSEDSIKKKAVDEMNQLLDKLNPEEDH